jgi:hypothetical protein
MLGQLETINDPLAFCTVDIFVVEVIVLRLLINPDNAITAVAAIPQAKSFHLITAIQILSYEGRDSSIDWRSVLKRHN